MESPITDAQIDAAMEVFSEEGVTLPYSARIENYVSADSEGDERAQQLAALKAADEEAEVKNRALVRRVLQAALPIPDEHEGRCTWVSRTGDRCRMIAHADGSPHQIEVSFL